MFYGIGADSSDYLMIILRDEKTFRGEYVYQDSSRRPSDFPIGDFVYFILSADIEDRILSRPREVFSAHAYSVLQEFLGHLPVREIHCADTVFYQVIPPIFEPVYQDPEIESIDWEATQKLVPADLHYFRFGEFTSGIFVSEDFVKQVQAHPLEGMEIWDLDDNLVFAHKVKYKRPKRKAHQLTVWQPPADPVPLQAHLETLMGQSAVQFQAAGLGEVWPQFQATAQYSIRLIPTAVEEHTLALGQSKLGGCPDLPPEIKWSALRSRDKKPLSFVGQLNCAELKAWDLEQIYPESGLLLFFCDHQSEGELGPWPCEGYFRVLYFQGDFATLKRQNPPRSLSSTDLGYACQLEFKPELNFSRWNPKTQALLDLTPEQRVLYQKHFEVFEEESEIHKLGGYPDHPMDMDAFDFLGPQFLQIDSSIHTGMDWANASGRLHFFLSPQALTQRLFEQVQLVVTYS